MALPRWLQLVKLLAPTIVAVAVPGVGPALAAAIADGIAEAEQIPGASGADKKAHVLNLVRAGAGAVNAASEPDALQQAQVDGLVSAVGSGIDTAVAVVNLIHQQHPAEVPEPGAGAGDGAPV